MNAERHFPPDAAAAAKRSCFARLTAATLLAAAGLMAAAPASAAPINFVTLDAATPTGAGNLAATTGQFQSKQRIYSATDVLNPGEPYGPFFANYWRNYFVVTFTASETKTGGVFGQTQSAVDTVLMLYQGVFDPLLPKTGILEFNDDTDAADHISILNDPAADISCLNEDRCPQITFDVTSGLTYSLVVTSFAGQLDPTAAASLGTLQTLYTDVAGTFGDGGGGGNVPEPTTLGLLGIGLLSGAMARRRANRASA